MHALVCASSEPHVELTEVPDPDPLPHQALVEVHAISLNRGEVRRLAAGQPGTVWGWDLAGVVRTAAADGSGPREGARVVGLMNPGAWAQLAAVRTEWLAELPDGVTFEQAASLPVAGLTALRALELGGYLVGKRVLITGASGGVGHFALQLARLAGAHVTALARRQEGVRELGADEVVDAVDLDGPEYEVVIDAVGGAVLGAALQRVSARGVVVNFALTAEDPVSYPTRSLFARAPGARLQGLYIFEELERTGKGSSDLRRLADLIAAGRLEPQIDATRSWQQAGEAMADLLEGRIRGKAILTVDSPGRP